MKVGVLGSSFNPPTMGHLATAQEVRTRLGLDKILFRPSSIRRNDKKINIADEHRWNMVKLAVEGNDYFEADNYEMTVPVGHHYTYLTMRQLKEKYPNDEFYFIMGADLLEDIPTEWMHAEEFLSENKMIVVQRNGIVMHEVVAKHKLLRKYEKNFTYIYKGMNNEISSSYIREEFEIGNDPRYHMPESVYQYIIDNQLYIEKDSE